MKEPEPKTKFQVFARYQWRGPDAGPILDAASSAVRQGEATSIPEFLKHRFDRHERGLLVLASIEPATTEMRTEWAPGERPDLFLSLASVDLTPTGIIEFVSEHGTLGGDRDDPVDLYHGWVRHVIPLRQMLGVWSAIQRADIEFLRAKIIWERGKRLSETEAVGHKAWFRPGDEWGKAAFDELDEEGRIAIEEPLGVFEMLLGFDDRWESGEVERSVEAAKCILRHVVNDHLAVSRPAQLDGSLKLAVKPKRLIDEIWWQFARAIDTGRRFLPCGQCGQFFEVSGGASRTDRDYCSTACKLKAYRGRMKRAMEMRRAGQTLREIARELGSDVETVKNWVSKEQEK